MTFLLLLLMLGVDTRTWAHPQSFLATSLHPADVSTTTTTTTPLPAPKLPRPEMYSLRVESRIQNRYARTVVTSRIANPANQSQEVLFSMVLPETAFISGFLMEVDGKVFEAYVREKEDAKQEYEQAVASGHTAAHVALSARDSNRFTVSVNVEPRQKVTFNLTYEELLRRRLGEYSHVINLRPGQEVRDLQVHVHLTESRNITALRVPAIRTGNEIDPQHHNQENPLATVVRPSSTQAHVSFVPSVQQQRDFASRDKEDSGMSGQFVVLYDVDRDPQAGEVLVDDGYFVHFFAPTELQPLRKHAIFVLDVSGSMGGRKIEQLKEAMEAILEDLNEGDFFNIVEFSYSVTVWNLDSTAQSAVFSPYNAYGDSPKPNPGPTPAFPATPEYKSKAKEIVKKMRAGGGTNIFDALKTATLVAHDGLQNMSTSGGAEGKPEPIIVFLTDGEPTVGEVRPGRIQSAVREANSGPQAASIFSLALGSDADLNFLKKLSLRNSGFARRIYEASDTALQLTDFYRQVASPLLANVTFTYPPDQVDDNSTTRRVFPTFFSGAELVVAGKLRKGQPLLGHVTGSSLAGDSVFSPAGTQRASSLERLWAYLTIQQLLEQHDLQTEEAATNSTDSKKKALQLALKYSFVTPVTSLVVVKPNDTHAVGSEVVQPAVDEGGGPHYALPLAGQQPPPLNLAAGPSGISSSVNKLSISPARPMLPGAPGQIALSTTRPPVYLTTKLDTSQELPITTDVSSDSEMLSGLDDLTWLEDVRNGSDAILLPAGENGTSQVYRLGLNETVIDGVTCLSGASREPGVCVTLQQCVLRVFSQHVHTYLNHYFCAIQDLAGVCCPERLYNENVSTTEKNDITTTSAISSE